MVTCSKISQLPGRNFAQSTMTITVNQHVGALDGTVLVSSVPHLHDANLPRARHRDAHPRNAFPLRRPSSGKGSLAAS
jgi:hypothetical protein